MKNYSYDELKKIYANRRNKLATFLKETNTSACVFIDSEAFRDSHVRYFTGQPSDAVLVIFSDGYTILIAWDEILAKQNAFYDKLIPYTKFNNDALQATKYAINLGSSHGINNKIKLPPYLTYLEYLKFIDGLNTYNCYSKTDSAFKFAQINRSIKDSYEIECIKEACKIGDIIINKIEDAIKSKKIKTEIDVALFIEKECRLLKCEGTGFETLAAGPSRSFAIHAFPSYTKAAWPDKGLSILDFGVVFNGYTSDTTLTIAKSVNKEQEQLINLVQKAYNECLEMYTNEFSLAQAAKHAETVFASCNRKMPHSLGHSIGLQVHESPRVSIKAEIEDHFEQGMILTLEPGLYDEKLGGVRLENDVLITQNGNEVLSHSRIIRL